MGMKSGRAWANAHLKLRALYDERVPPGMTQKDFGKRYGIGSQSMVAQYLSGARPLNFEAAAKFAKALHCTIFDICPEMAEEIWPVLGKPLRRAAAILLFLLAPFFAQSDANAYQLFNIKHTEYTLEFKRWLRRFAIFCRGQLSPS